MICKNCGAELQEDVRSCPFCGADNFEQSLKEHQDTVNDSNRRAYFWKSLPDRMAKISGKAVIIGLVLFFAVAAIVAVVGAGMKRADAKRQYQREMQTIEELETLYQEGDYDAVAEKYLESTDRYGAKFAKYSETELLNYCYHCAKDSMEQDIALAKRQQSEEFLYSQVSWFELLRYCVTYEKEGYRYDEEEMVSYYRQEAMTVLQEELKFSGPQIALILEEYQQIEDYEEREEYEEKLQKLIYDSVTRAE